MTPPIKVLLADDHRVVIDVIKDLLASVDDILVVAAETDGPRAIAGALRFHPDVIVLDLSLPGCDGLTALQSIRQEIDRQRILVLTVSENRDDLVKALQYGARGYILKRDRIQNVVSAIRGIAEGRIIISHRLISRLISEFRNHPPDWDNLPPNDRRILNLFESGLTPPTIAERVCLPEDQVETRLQLFLETLSYRFRSVAEPGINVRP